MSLEQELHRSILSGSITNIRKLIAGGADVNANHASETACTRAITIGIQTVIDAILYSDHCDVNAINRDERSPLFVAVEYGRLQVVEQLLSLGADINKSDYRKTSPLIMAIRQGHTMIAKYLIENGADLTRQTFNGETAIYAACEKVNSEIVKACLIRGVETNVQTNSLNSRTGFTPLMIALPSSYELRVQKRRKSDMLQIVRMLIETGCDVNIQDERGNTALHRATDFLDVHTVCILAKANANLQIKNSFGESAFDIAIKHKSDGLSIATCLLLYGYRIDDLNYARHILKTILTFSSNSQTFQKKYLLELLLKIIPSGSQYLENCIMDLQCNSIEQELLMSCCHFQTLVEHCRHTIRRNIQTQLLAGISSLHIAKSLKVFLALGYDILHNDPVSLCDLLLAIRENDADTITALINTGISLDVSIMDYTPLTLASSLGNVEIVELLLKHGANPTVFDNRGNSAMHEAALVGNTDILKILLNRECDINVVNFEGEPPVLLAALSGRFSALQYLVHHGAEYESCNRNGIYAISLAAASGHLSACETMLDRGVSVNQRDFNGNTPLHLAASCGLIYTANNIDLPALYPSESAMHLDSIRNLFGRQPSTMYFSETKQDGTSTVRHLDVVRLLLQYDADKYAFNNDGKGPITVAKRFNHDDIVDILNQS